MLHILKISNGHLNLKEVVYGQDCDDTEYRDYKGYPAWKGYGGWLSECDSIRSVNLDREFFERAEIRQERTSNSR